MASMIVSMLPLLVAMALVVAFPEACDRAYVAVANVVTFGWYRRWERRRYGDGG